MAPVVFDCKRSLILLAVCLAGAIPVAAVLASARIGAQQKQQTDPALRWESEVEAYERQDTLTPPPRNATVFVGSSTIRIWRRLPEDFAPMAVIARGVGGCEMSDVLYYADRLILRYHPRRVVVYAGDNDIADHKDASRVFSDFRALVGKIHKALPAARIYFLSIKPSPSRDALWPEDERANKLVREYAERTPGVFYVDTAARMLDSAGMARPELFSGDMLHMNRAGYALWIPIIRSALANRAARAGASGKQPARGAHAAGARQATHAADAAWWDGYPRFVQTDDPAEAAAAHATATLCGGADDPTWGLFGQRQRISGGGRTTIERLHAKGIKALAWFEGFGTAGACYVAEVKRGKNGAWQTTAADRTLTRIFHNHWDWQLYDGAGDIRWVGPQNYFDDDHFARPYTRTNPRYGCPPMTYPSGRVATGYSGPAGDPRNSRVLDAGCSKDVLGRITFEYEYNAAVNRIDPTTGKPRGPLAGLVNTGDAPASTPDPGFTPEEWARLHRQQYSGCLGAGKDSACPLWIDYARASVRAALDAGIDGLWVDNFSPWDSFNAKPILKAFGDWSVAGFRGYLRQRFAPGTLRSAGITELASFDVRRYLQNRCREWGGDPSNLDDPHWLDSRWQDDPLWRAYLIYKRRVGTRALSRYYRTIKEEAARAGKPDFLICGNDIPVFSLGWPRGDLDMVSTELSWGWGLTTGPRGLMPPPLGSYAPVYKLAREHTRGRCVNAWMYLPESELGKPNIARTLYYEAMANDAGPMPEYPGRTAGTKKADADFFRFAAKAATLAVGCKPVDEVGLYYSSSSQLMEMLPGGFHNHADQQHSFSFYGWGTALTQLHIPWRAVPEWKLDARTLRGLRALIVPSAQVFPAASVAALATFVRQGGGLIVAGRSGVRMGEEGNFDSYGDGSILDDLARVRGRIEYLHDDPGLAFYRAEKERPTMLPGLERAVVRALGTRDTLSLDAPSAPWQVGLTPYVGSDRMLVDVNNTDIDVEHDRIRSHGPIRFMLRLPDAWHRKKLRVQVVSPDRVPRTTIRRIGESRAEVTLAPIALFARVAIAPIGGERR